MMIHPSLPPLYFHNNNNTSAADVINQKQQKQQQKLPASSSLLSSLPSELLTYCLQYADWGDLARLAVTQRSFQQVLYATANTSAQAKWQLATALLLFNGQQPILEQQQQQQDNDNSNNDSSSSSSSSNSSSGGLAPNPLKAIQLLQELAAIPVDPVTQQPILDEDVVTVDVAADSAAAAATMNVNTTTPFMSQHHDDDDDADNKAPDNNNNNNDITLAAAAMKQLAFLHWQQGQQQLSGVFEKNNSNNSNYNHAETGLAWMKAAFYMGHDVQAAHELAVVYEHGRHNVPVDSYQAVEWFRMAAELGHVEAMAELGLCYELGLPAPVVEQSDELALEWYMRAANAGHLIAKYAVGEAFEEARGVPQSDEEACLWYYKAAIEGDEDSRKALRRLEDVARIVLPPGVVGKLLDD